MSYEIKKILIPHATGPRNPGDQAILLSEIELLRNIFPSVRPVVHSSDPNLYTDSSFASSLKHTIYSWVVFDNPKAGVRFLRFFEFLVRLFF